MNGIEISPNDKNIKNLGDSIYDIRRQFVPLIKELLNSSNISEKVVIRPDTFIVNGVEDNGLIWKDIMIENLYIGYYNTSINRKELFEKVLGSLRILKKWISKIIS